MAHQSIRPMLLAALLTWLSSFSAHALDLGVSYAVMATPDDTYLEVNLEIEPRSISWNKIDSTHWQSSAEITIIIKQGEKVITFEKYLLNSPVLGNYADLLDVKRLAVPNGQYELEVTATDQLDLKNKATIRRLFTVDYKANEACLSDIQFLRSFRPDQSEHPFVKNGNYLEPMPFRFYDQHASVLAFYAEIYHTQQVVTDPTYSVRFMIEQDLGNGQTKLVSVGNQKKRPSPIDAVVVQSDISQLESGNYFLTIELRTKDNVVLATRKLDFQRRNPFKGVTDADLTQDVISKQFVQNLTDKELEYALTALTPIISYGTQPEELKNILKAKNLESMRFFLFRHFARVDVNNPEGAYKKYIAVANAADAKFHSGFRYGFETDRGRMYMKYGLPDDMVHVEDDPSAPPYEIWIYYDFKATNQRNVKFLFYNPTLAGDDYITLHSTARGEISNPRWETVLYKRNAPTQFDGDNSWDATQMQSNVNRNARWYFEDY